MKHNLGSSCGRPSVWLPWVTRAVSSGELGEPRAYPSKEVASATAPYFNREMRKKWPSQRALRFIAQADRVVLVHGDPHLVKGRLLCGEAVLPNRAEPTTPDSMSTAVDGSLDRSVVATSRVEQDWLRLSLLHGRPAGECALCGHAFPSTMLTCAHVYPRHLCSGGQRLDRNNVMLTCPTCDRLYEVGYLEVANGRIQPGVVDRLTPHLQAHIHDLLGRACSAWNEVSAKYFRARQALRDCA